MKTLNIEKRDVSGKKLNSIRKTGKMPAVFYGPKEESTPISISATDFLKIWKEAGESTVISLEGVGDEKEALIHDVKCHPVSGLPLHADFYIFKKGEKINVNVPLEYIGVSPAVKELGASLVKVMHELEIEALPRNLPHEIKVDISTLVDFESQITIGDIGLPEGVTSLADQEDVVALVTPPAEEEEEEVVEFDESMVEVEKKGKETEEEEESAEKVEEKTDK